MHLKKYYYILVFCFLVSPILLSQQNSISIKSKLDPKEDQLKIQQEIIFHNTSDSTLTSVYLHNWANSYRDKKTPLFKRFIKDFKKDLYFAKEKELGSSTIKSMTVDFESSNFKELNNRADILEIFLNKPLSPNSKIKIVASYIVKIPSARFTNYGKSKTGYHLRNWYLTPAIYQNGWQLMSNLNLDDLYENKTDFKIDIEVPKGYVIESNLLQHKTEKQDRKNCYQLVGINKTDIILGINKKREFKKFTTKENAVHTNIFSEELGFNLTTDILNRELLFIQKYLGKYPHYKIYIDRATQSKNSIYGLNQLPKFLRPFSDTFKWDITMFKAVSKRYIENTILLNKRKDYWLIDALQNYLMIEYIDHFYPEVKLLGNASNSWLLKKFNISQLKFNDKYPLVYEFTAREFLDQALTTSADSLSNFNRKIVNKYKAGLGLRFLKGYLGERIVNKTIKEFYQNNQLKIISSAKFKQLLSSKTTKNLDWFFDEFLKTTKKIDHTIEEIIKEEDSISVTVKNKRNTTSPFAIYALKDKDVKFQKWVSDIDSSKTIKFKRGDYDTFVLNYENLYPELNVLDNWRQFDKKIFNKPVKLSFLKDVSDPNFNQLFYQPGMGYNYYNGVTLGLTLHNKSLIKRNFEFSVSPYYGTKSNTVLGQFSILYNQFFEKTKIYNTSYGLVGSTSDYAPNLSYRSLIPHVKILFKRKSLRDATTESVVAKLVHIDKETGPNSIKTPQDNYSVFSLSYNYVNPDIIKEFRYRFSAEFAKNFSKATVDLRFRSLTSSNTQLDFRLFAGAFLNNKTTGDYFSFGLDRSNDYLFQLNYFGRSESKGLFSQQYIISEGGFKSILPTRFANEYMIATNSSIGLWRWVELYTDVAFLKNRNKSIYFGYENGIRFNFIHQIFEIYFPIYSNNGWELSQTAYAQKIRFSLSADMRSIYNFFRRGFL
jgi:hypothetical protein